jgi:hypothetical protein
MRSLRHFASVLSLLAVIICQSTVSHSQSPRTSTGNSTHAEGKPRADQGKSNCTSNGTYVNSKGKTVQRPETCASAPQGATAQCRDGSYSFSRSHRGTCSHHGGVAKWL